MSFFEYRATRLLIELMREREDGRCCQHDSRPSHWRDRGRQLAMSSKSSSTSFLFNSEREGRGGKWPACINSIYSTSFVLDGRVGRNSTTQRLSRRKHNLTSVVIGQQERETRKSGSPGTVTSIQMRKNQKVNFNKKRQKEKGNQVAQLKWQLVGLMIFIDS